MQELQLDEDDDEAELRDLSEAEREYYLEKGRQYSLIELERVQGTEAMIPVIK